MKNKYWTNFIVWLSFVKDSFLNKKYSLTDITATLALLLSMYQFYIQNIERRKEEYEKKFSTIRDSSKKPDLADILHIKEILNDIDTEKNYKRMSDVQKETLALGYSLANNHKRSFEISKENIELNIRNNNFDAAKIYYDNFIPSALSLGEINTLTSFFNQFDKYYTNNKDGLSKYNLNSQFSLFMLEYWVYENNLQEVLKHMRKFCLYFDAEDFEKRYFIISSRISPEIENNYQFIELNKVLTSKYKSSVGKNKAYIEELIDGMEDFYNRDSEIDEPSVFDKK